MGLIYINENLVKAGNAIAASSTNANSLFPLSNIRDGYPGSLFKFNAAAADDFVSFDLNVVDGWDFEDWDIATLPNDWTDASTGTGALSEGTSTPNPNDGSSYLELAGNGGGNIAIATQDITLYAGVPYKFRTVAHGNTVGPTEVQFYIKETGQYIKSDGTLQTTQIDFVSQTAAEWSLVSAVVTMPTFAIALSHTVTIEIKCYTQAAVGYVDATYVHPHSNFVSIHGHNLGNSGHLVPTIVSDNDSAFGDTTALGTMDIERPAFYKVISETTERYVKITFVGTHSVPIELGEVVLGFSSTLSRFWNAGAKTKFKMPQKKNVSPGLQRQILNLGADPIRTTDLSIMGLTEAQMEEVRDELILRTGYGRKPLIVVPDTDRDMVLHGRFEKDNWDYIINHGGAAGTYNYKLTIIEDPFAVSIS